MLVRKFSFAPMEAKIQLFKSYCYPIYGCALWRHSYQYSIRKLTVSYSDTFKRLINVLRYTSSSLAFAMNTTDHINVVHHKSAFSLMSRVTTSPNSIVAAIVNSDAYHQSPLMVKCESMLYVQELSQVELYFNMLMCEKLHCNQLSYTDRVAHKSRETTLNIIILFMKNVNFFFHNL